MNFHDLLDLLTKHSACVVEFVISDSLSVCGKDKASRRLLSATRCRLLNHQPHSSTFFGRFGIRSTTLSLWPRKQFLHLHRLPLGPTSASNAIYNLDHRFFVSAERSQQALHALWLESFAFAAPCRDWRQPVRPIHTEN